MKIIMLKGPNDSGKTSTLHLVYNKLTSNKDVKHIENKKITSNPPNKIEDFACILEYDNKKVAIFTMGDYVKGKNGIWNVINDYTNKSVDVLIIANSNKPIPENSIRQHNYVLVIKMKALASPLHEAENKVYMQQIIDLI